MWIPNESETEESTKCPHIVLSPVSLASRDQDDGPVELNDRHLRSHGKIGDCEQSILSVIFNITEGVRTIFVLFCRGGGGAVHVFAR